MKNMIQPIKGTRDFYPDDMAIRNWLYNQARKVSESFGYQEYEGPYLEPIELYAAKSGEELVKEQSFVFPDRGGDLITLRPELTPTLARMVAQKQRQLIYPLRWWSWGPFWRYERPQKGRGREFFQWNIDLIGIDSPEADAEMIAIAATFFKEIGLLPSEVQILVNNRRLIDAQFERIGIPTNIRPEVLRWIDRRDKLSAERWIASAREIGLTNAQVNELQGPLSDEDLWRQSPELSRLFPAIEMLGVAEYVRFAPQIIRGLQYYTGTVFEAWDLKGEFRALFGGGRYDNLVADVGGDPLPAVGFALGDMVITVLLQKFDRLPDLPTGAPLLVTTFDQSLMLASLSLANELRRAGIPTVSYPEAEKIGKQFKFANRAGIELAIILGPEEQANKQVAIKDLRSGEQMSIARDQLENTLREKLRARLSS